MHLLHLFAFIFCASLLCAGVSGYDDFGKTCVLSHNGLRKLHGAQPVAWSEELAEEATKWCEKLAIQDQLENDNRTMDSKNEGENIAATSATGSKSEGPSPELCAMAVDQWYSEMTNYNYETGLPNSPGLPIKHFAQIVWNSTFEIGAGTARSSAHGDIVCVRYSPRGAEGDPDTFKANVFPAEGTLPSIPSEEGTKSFGAQQTGQTGKYSGSITCGVGKRSRIVGGEQARPSELPWQVGFRYESPYGRTNIFCGGTLIDENWVVTAAHCFQKPNNGMTLKVILGEFDTQNEEGNEVIIPAKKVVRTLSSLT